MHVYNRRRAITLKEDRIVTIEHVSVRGMLRLPGLGIRASAEGMARNASAAEREPLFMRLGFTRFRERQRTIDSLPGEELMLGVRETNLTTGYDFQWEMAGKEDDIFAPLLTLELRSGTNPVSGGKPVQSSLSEQVMLELWDRLSSSIRIRPTAELDRSAAGK